MIGNVIFFQIQGPGAEGYNSNFILSSLEKESSFHPAPEQERGMMGSSGFADIRFEIKPIAMFEDGTMFEYSKITGLKKLES